MWEVHDASSVFLTVVCKTSASRFLALKASIHTHGRTLPLRWFGHIEKPSCFTRKKASNCLKSCEALGLPRVLTTSLVLVLGNKYISSFIGVVLIIAG